MTVHVPRHGNSVRNVDLFDGGIVRGEHTHGIKLKFKPQLPSLRFSSERRREHP